MSFLFSLLRRAKNERQEQKQTMKTIKNNEKIN